MGWPTHYGDTLRRDELVERGSAMIERGRNLGGAAMGIDSGRKGPGRAFGRQQWVSLGLGGTPNLLHQIHQGLVGLVIGGDLGIEGLQAVLEHA